MKLKTEKCGGNQYNNNPLQIIVIKLANFYKNRQQKKREKTKKHKVPIPQMKLQTALQIPYTLRRYRSVKSLHT